MRRLSKTFLLLLLSVTCLFFIFSYACDNKNKGDTVVELTMNNYQTYLNVRHTTVNYHQMEAEGCLSFAVYENVVITLSRGEIMYLNAAGQGMVRIEYDSYIVGITGQVRYRI